MHEEVQGMTGSRLGRGRSGRIAMYVGCGVVMLLLVYLYRTTTWEMAKLHDLHEQCVHQQEALAAQLQVIFEYKVRLEKSLAEEKSSNAMVKQELQQRASREKSLRDKDSVEAMQRFNSLQQTYKLLQTEHQDLQEECKKHEKQALDETNRLQVTLQELRSRVRKMYDDKNALENFKTKFLELDSEKTELEEKYREVLMSALNSDSVIEHLRKEIIQLKKEMENRKSQKSFTPIPTSSSTLASQQTLKKGDSQPIPAPQQQQPQQQNVMHDSTSSRKMENTTVANYANLVSPSQADRVAPLMKLPMKLSKVKLPVGVLPIPEIIEQKIEENVNENKHQDDLHKREDTAARNNPPLKFAPVNAVDSSKEEKEEAIEAGNLDPPFVANPPAAGVHHGEQIADRRMNNEAWFRGVRPGVQEVGEEINQLGRVPGLDDGQANGGDDQYDGGDYDKEPLQRNGLAEGEDEGEDEGDMLEYPHNLKQEKRE